MSRLKYRVVLHTGHVSSWSGGGGALLLKSEWRTEMAPVRDMVAGVEGSRCKVEGEDKAEAEARFV